jgi:hypothetical protein
VNPTLNLGYEYLGELSVKNISKPVQAYRVLLAPDNGMKLMREEIKTSTINWIAIVAAMIGIILLIILHQICYNNLW